MNLIRSLVSLGFTNPPNKNILKVNTEVVAKSWSINKLLLEISQSLQGNVWDSVLFSRVVTLLQHVILFKKGVRHTCSSVNFTKFSKTDILQYT